MLSRFNLIIIILLVVWISFIPEPIQSQCQSLIRVFLALLLFFTIIRKKFNVKSIFNKQDIPLWLLCLAMLCGIFKVENFQLALNRYISIFVPGFLLYYIFKNEFRNKNREIILKTICYSASVVALIGIIEFATGKNFIYTYTNIWSDLPYRFAYPRVMATQLHPVILGSYFAVALPVCLPFIFGNFSSQKKPLVICIVIIVLGIILTFSRGSIISVLCAGFVYFVFNKKKIKIKKYALYIITLAIILSILLSFNGRFISRVLTHKEMSGRRNFSSTMFRYAVTFRIFKDHYLKGVGFDHYREFFDKYNLEKREFSYWHKIPDNMYFMFIAETGIIGLSSFLMFIIFIFIRGFRLFFLTKDEYTRQIQLAIIASFSSLSINMLTYELLYWINPLFLFWIFTGMVASFSDV